MTADIAPTAPTAQSLRSAPTAQSLRSAPTAQSLRSAVVTFLGLDAGTSAPPAPASYEPLAHDDPAAALKWLNSWGCRIRYPRTGEPDLFAPALHEWTARWYKLLPQPGARLGELTDDDIAPLGECYADLCTLAAGTPGRPGPWVRPPPRSCCTGCARTPWSPGTRPSPASCTAPGTPRPTSLTSASTGTGPGAFSPTAAWTRRRWPTCTGVPADRFPRCWTTTRTSH
ncbi:hypothetical protein KJK32_24680 [Streptomyces sp. JCM17656]|nr:hypothetical protein KJK32_24680 [Streptomyces sp. JCM17656]